MNHDDYIKVAGFRGVACVYLGPGKRWVPATYIAEDEDGAEYEAESDEGEWESDDSIARIRMVGDDRVYEVDPDDCTPLAEDAFCADCGQLGCSHGRYT